MSAGGGCPWSRGCWVEMDVHCDGGQTQGHMVRQQQGGAAMGDAEAVVDGGQAGLGTLQGQRGAQALFQSGRWRGGRRAGRQR